MSRRVGLAAVAALTCAGLAAPLAQATYHDVRISEVHADSGVMGANPDYVELQMLSGGQGQLSGHYIQTYSTGTIFTTYQFPSNVSGASGQKTVLIAAANQVDGDQPDFFANGGDLNVPTGSGTICYIDQLPATGIDCVQYGLNYSLLSGGNPSPFGSPALSPDGLNSGQTLQRSMQRGCQSLLEASDDTNDSASDFALGAPSPRTNDDAPSGLACPQTTIKKGPGKTTTDRTPSFKFKASVGNSTFRCKLDGKAFAKCKASTTLKKLSFGKHTLKVFATNALGGRDKSPAKAKFTVKK